MDGTHQTFFIVRSEFIIKYIYIELVTVSTLFERNAARGIIVRLLLAGKPDRRQAIM